VTRRLPPRLTSQGAGVSTELPGELTGEGLEQAWTVEQERLAVLLPDARRAIAHESEHYIQLQQPELVIAAMREVVEAVGDPAGAATPEP
jgi:hypothetical protein